MTIQVKSGTPYFEVYDMPASLAFYRDLLGFEVVSRAPDGPITHWALLRHGEAKLMLNTKYEFDYERPPQPDATNSRRDVALYFLCDDVDAAYAELRSKGWLHVDEPKTAPYGWRQLYLRDPDGLNLCLQHPVST